MISTSSSRFRWPQSTHTSENVAIHTSLARTCRHINTEIRPPRATLSAVSSLRPQALNMAEQKLARHCNFDESHRFQHMIGTSSARCQCPQSTHTSEDVAIHTSLARNCAHISKETSSAAPKKGWSRPAPVSKAQYSSACALLAQALCPPIFCGAGPEGPLPALPQHACMQYQQKK